MKHVVIDAEKTFGDLFYIGSEPVYEYKNNRRTDKVIGYNYNLASSVQGDKITVKVLGDKREFAMMEKVQLVDPDVKIYATTVRDNFAVVNYAVSASDIVKG